MKKIYCKCLIAIAILSLMSFFFRAQAQQTAQIGLGTQAPLTNGSIYSPICRFNATSTNDCSRSNLLYTATELNSAGITNGVTINKISFFKIGTGASIGGFTFQIHMRNSPLAPPLTATTWANILTTHTQVYATTAQTIPATSGWVEFTLNTPFVYTGQSLEIAMTHDMTGVSGNPSTGSFDWQYTNGFQDNVIGIVSSSLTGVANLNGTVANYKVRPNIQFDYSTGTANPVTLTGTSTICVGGSTTLVGAPTGGTFSSATPTVATVNSSTGVVTGVAAGTSVITYTNGANSATLTVTVNAAPATPSPITGNTNICIGGTSTLANTTANGTWMSSNAAVATVSNSGSVSGLTAGTTTITYTVTNASGCSAAVNTTVTVSAVPVVIPISGASDVCIGATVALNNTTTGGIWSSDNVQIATVSNSGVVTGVSAGNAVITYTVSNAGCSTSVNKPIAVNPLPTPVITHSGAALSTTTFASYSWALNGNPIPGANTQSHTAVTNGNYTVTVTDANGCSGTSPAVLVSGLSLRNANIEKSVLIFPNPATNMVNIKADQEVSITVSGLDGRVFLNIKKASFIDISGLAKGMYLLKVFDKNGQFLQAEKLLKADN